VASRKDRAPAEEALLAEIARKVAAAVG